MENELIASDRAVNKIKPEGLARGQTYGYRIVSQGARPMKRAATACSA